MKFSGRTLIGTRRFYFNQVNLVQYCISYTSVGFWSEYITWYSCLRASWYNTRKCPPRWYLVVIMGVLFQHSHDSSLQRHTSVISEAVIQLRCFWWEQKYHSKHIEQPRNNTLSYTVSSFWSFLYIISQLELFTLFTFLIVPELVWMCKFVPTV
jgi:hypothetical protein